MQELNKAIETTVHRVAEGITASTRQSIQPYKTPARLSRKVFDKGMAYLEAAKQENFSSETLLAWWIEMNRMQWTDEDFRRGVYSALRGTTYGKVKFEDFLTTENLYSAAEVYVIVNQTIEKRKEEYLQLHKVLHDREEELAKEGLGNVQGLYNRRAEEYLERVEMTFKKRSRRVENFIRNASPKVQEEILEIALVKKIIVKDGYWVQILPLCAPFLLTEVERFMLQLR